MQDDDVEVGALWDPAMSWRPPSWLSLPAPHPPAGAALPAAGCQHAAASSDHSSSECTTATATASTNTSGDDGGINSRSCGAEFSSDDTAHKDNAGSFRMKKAETAMAASLENVEAQQPHLQSSMSPSDAVCIQDAASDLQEGSDTSSSEAETDTEPSSQAEAVAQSDATTDGQSGGKQLSTGSSSLFGRLDALFTGGSSSRGGRGAAGRGHPRRGRGHGTRGGGGTCNSTCDSSSMESFALRAGALQLLQHGGGAAGQGGTEVGAPAPHTAAAAAGREAPVHTAPQLSSAAVTAKQQQAVGGDSNRNPVTVLGRSFPGTPGAHARNGPACLRT